MPIEAPTAEQVLDIAESYGMSLTEAAARSFTGLMSGIALSYDRLDAVVEPRPKVNYARTTGARPEAKDNPYNAWA